MIKSQTETSKYSNLIYFNYRNCVSKESALRLLPDMTIHNGSREIMSRKQRRRQSSIPVSTNSNDEQITITQSSDLSISLSSLHMSTTRLLVCSIGNPGQYIGTLHSAGHTVLSTLAFALSYPSFQKSRAYGNGLVSSGSDITLWQSSSLMNVSGVGVATAWRQFVKESRGEDTRLVVVHDELELPLGQVKVRSGLASPKGHNGLKSIKQTLPGVDYTRIGVGIGRPESREPDIVAAYVLRKMSGSEKMKVEGCVGKVEAELRKLAA
jgi:PTH1 family peptidyl-tRNA hydrolase